uniref:Flavone synthase II n=3 Tax=Lonicera japonica TaxID=105884 RepID=A0A142FX91_LONJA|nr:flavone synthase II [Lonicera japonica]AMX23489.1 flavone synthase II [Lonicera japonica]
MWIFDLTISFTTLLFLIFTTALLLLLKVFKKNHKLRPPPSPFTLPIIGHLHLLGPLIHQSFHRLSTLYGPLIQLKIGYIPCVVASTPELAKEFLKTHELAFSSRKHSAAIKLLTYDVSFAFSPYGPYWKFIKKTCTFELLGTRNMNHFLPIRTNEIRRFLQVMLEKAKASEGVNVTEELIKLTNNVISQMMFSTRSSGTEGEAEEMRTLVREVTQIFGEFNVSDFIKLCKNIDIGGFKKRSKDIQKRYDALLEKIISERESERARRGKNRETLGEEGGKDFLDMMLDTMEDGKCEVEITRDHIKALVLDFLTAATDTTAIAVEWTLAELISNPEVFDKAREEIDKVVGKHRLVTELDTPNLPYIHAIIKESFRLHPPIPLLIRKSVQDCTVGGYHISANTILFVNIWAIGRNPKYWESPMKFWPERFLESNGPGPVGSMDIKGHHYELLPFGSGRRGCPGMALAMQELPVVLAAMIQCFNWKPVTLDGEELDMSERPGLTAPRAHDLVCVPSARINSFDNF